tara:strand:- start:135 stop:317 length:183 start_codon:yes stop_codon:yes gene_type:complete
VSNWVLSVRFLALKKRVIGVILPSSEVTQKTRQKHGCFGGLNWPVLVGQNHGQKHGCFVG